jgi:hypothetical protein
MITVYPIKRQYLPYDKDAPTPSIPFYNGFTVIRGVQSTNVQISKYYYENIPDPPPTNLDPIHSEVFKMFLDSDAIIGLSINGIGLKPIQFVETSKIIDIAVVNAANLNLEKNVYYYILIFDYLYINYLPNLQTVTEKITLSAQSAKVPQAIIRTLFRNLQSGSLPAPGYFLLTLDKLRLQFNALNAVNTLPETNKFSQSKTYALTLIIGDLVYPDVNCVPEGQNTYIVTRKSNKTFDFSALESDSNYTLVIIPTVFYTKNIQTTYKPLIDLKIAAGLISSMLLVIIVGITVVLLYNLIDKPEEVGLRVADFVP